MFGVKRNRSRAPPFHYSDLPRMWRLLSSPPLDGPDNMALDVALMRRARRTGETVLRIYTWRRPTLSFGRHQQAAGAYDPAELEAAGLGVVRRPTGGRALLHYREVTYSVTAPTSGSLDDAYAGINVLLMNALSALGVPVAAFRATRRAAPPSAAPCFAEPAAGELVADGGKLVGSAQWRDDGAMLQHGSILVDDDQGLVARLAGEAPPPPPATLRGLLGRAPSADEVGRHLRSAVRALADPGADWFDLEAAVEDEARLLAAHYRDPAWTWRR
ncbi:MAG: biotin/lipoate protein ligase [Gemmatimonadetes bacterium]|jgi:lipoate-protein ligase A|nr:biotin/lipoate protein ligase [Gemmatimonadota bacterium]